MFVIRKSTLRRVGIAAVVAAILAAVAVTVVGAAGVTIVTPSTGNEQLTIDGKVIGTYPVYNGAADLNVTYPAYSFPAGAKGSYKLSIWQNTTPAAASPTWTEIHVNHHWASDPNPTTFTFGPFLASEHLCENCPSVVVVQPETVEAYEDGSGTTQYRYTPLVAALTSGPAALTESNEVLFHGTAIPGGGSCQGGACQSICRGDVTAFCISDCGSGAGSQCVKDCIRQSMSECLNFCKMDREPGGVCASTCGDGFCTFVEDSTNSCPADCGGGGG